MLVGYVQFCTCTATRVAKKMTRSAHEQDHEEDHENFRIYAPWARKDELKATVTCSKN